MRIVAGVWRGRRIEEPRGREVTRPTTDRVREACASVLDSALDEGIDGARVLDAFAGSGALGIEMLARGRCMPRSSISTGRPPRLSAETSRGSKRSALPTVW